jgi:hypothetical protein
MDIYFLTFVKIPQKSNVKYSAFKVSLHQHLTHPVLLFTQVPGYTWPVSRDSIHIFTPAGTYFYYFLKQGHKSSNFNFSFSWNRFLDHKKLNL